MNKLALLKGVPFRKMTGSGNDFVFFDSREAPGESVMEPEAIVAICNRHNGIGADGIVLLEPQSGSANARIRYFNSDGSPADLCGNATLCSTALSIELGLGPREHLQLVTDAGLITGRLDREVPEIDLARVSGARVELPIERVAGEERIGFALVGVPHAVVLVQDVDRVDLDRRGAQLRRHEAAGAPGANVNFVARTSDGTWRYRTFERGVEGETLACGTGAVATAVLLEAWGLASSPVSLRTSSGRILRVRLGRNVAYPESVYPSLQGEGRVVFRGLIGELA